MSDEAFGGGVGKQAAAPNDDQVVGGECHFAHEVTGDEEVRPSEASDVNR